MIDKYESRRIRAEVRRVLSDVWDPIGVKDEPNAQDEYRLLSGFSISPAHDWRDG